jgi:hypothetical protein
MICLADRQIGQPPILLAELRKASGRVDGGGLPWSAGVRPYQQAGSNCLRVEKKFPFGCP